MSEEEQKHLMQSYYDLHEKYYKLKTQLQQKENIIKEVREYIGTERFLYNPNFINSENITKILDKVGDNNE